MSPKLNRERAEFVLTKIDEILAWEQRKEAERDTRWVELGRSALHHLKLEVNPRRSEKLPPSIAPS